MAPKSLVDGEIYIFFQTRQVFLDRSHQTHRAIELWGHSKNLQFAESSRFLTYLLA